ncbi:MAG: HNH endonuclease [Proteobacteria bacterium]|nr:HNH endonuclease [Pseudomonadota bacterium]
MEFLELPGDRPVLLNNQTCPYCGVSFEVCTRTKDHVIARKFVPTGKLNKSWNLILWACRPCNQKKGDLEDDLSAIAMQPDAHGRFPERDSAVAADAARKARKSISRRTGKPVKDSAETLTLRSPFGSYGQLVFTLTSPPQANRDRLVALARLQLMACFYYVTYNDQTCRGGFWRGECYSVVETMRCDWGNDLMVAFMKMVEPWTPNLIATAADGFFQVAIRRDPSAICWSWAVEWNRNFRAVGFFGEPALVEPVLKQLPMLQAETIAVGPRSTIAYRCDVPLSGAEDTMFEWTRPNEPEPFAAGGLASEDSASEVGAEAA